jgi:hypothetical protein
MSYPNGHFGLMDIVLPNQKIVTGYIDIGIRVSMQERDRPTGKRAKEHG